MRAHSPKRTFVGLGGGRESRPQSPVYHWGRVEPRGRRGDGEQAEGGQAEAAGHQSGEAGAGGGGRARRGGPHDGVVVEGHL